MIIRLLDEKNPPEAKRKRENIMPHCIMGDFHAHALSWFQNGGRKITDMLHELLLALAGDSGGIFVYKKSSGLQVCSSFHIFIYYAEFWLFSSQNLHRLSCFVAPTSK